MTLITIQEASEWATKHLKKDISPTNISYLIQYARVKKHEKNGSTLIDLNDLKEYYQLGKRKREEIWQQKLEDGLNWALSFDNLRERDTTKHVHRLHPYKGKFIPQLVEYFIDSHTDNYKRETYFKAGDILLDPFAGSGTTLVQANEMSIHGIGIDISRFNCMISQAKLYQYDFDSLCRVIRHIQNELIEYEHNNNIERFDKELAQRLARFNAEYFPSPDFKHRVFQKKIDEDTYGKEKEREFLLEYNALLKKYAIKLKQSNSASFLDIWYCENIRKEIDMVFDLIKNIKDAKNKQLAAVILSRTIRSCRATRHGDLATLKEPEFTTYYCWKHKKICKPLYSIKYWFNRYAQDTLKRLKEFDCLRSGAFSAAISADSQSVDLFAELEKRNRKLYEVARKQKIKGIFSSPPYIGQIDYHEQHAYAYDLFGFERKDDLEIGPLYKGQGRQARQSYIDGISKVLLNCRKYLADNFDIFLVANDKHNLYPTIAANSGIRIVNVFKRPVLNRTERSKVPYAESIFHCKAISGFAEKQPANIIY